MDVVISAVLYAKKCFNAKNVPTWCTLPKSDLRECEQCNETYCADCRWMNCAIFADILFVKNALPL